MLPVRHRGGDGCAASPAAFCCCCCRRRCRRCRGRRSCRCRRCRSCCLCCRLSAPSSVALAFALVVVPRRRPPGHRDGAGRRRCRRARGGGRQEGRGVDDSPPFPSLVVARASAGDARGARGRRLRARAPPAAAADAVEGGLERGRRRAARGRRSGSGGRREEAAALRLGQRRQRTDASRARLPPPAPLPLASSCFSHLARHRDDPEREAAQQGRGGCERRGQREETGQGERRRRRRGRRNADAGPMMPAAIDESVRPGSGSRRERESRTRGGLCIPRCCCAERRRHPAGRGGVGEGAASRHRHQSE